MTLAHKKLAAAGGVALLLWWLGRRASASPSGGVRAELRVEDGNGRTAETPGYSLLEWENALNMQEDGTGPIVSPSHSYGPGASMLGDDD